MQKQKLMKWYCPEYGDEEATLLVNDTGTWQSYRSHRYYTPSPNVPGHSKGWGTFQKLLKLGYTLVKSDN